MGHGHADGNLIRQAGMQTVSQSVSQSVRPSVRQSVSQGFAYKRIVARLDYRRKGRK